jgi:regulator of sigma E protease
MDYVIYFALTIGILVFVHEFGHFAAAKLCGMRADVFAIGFGKRLFGYNKITGFTFGDLPKDFDGGGRTDYRLCLLPLGGYVKIAGMVDESFDTDFADKEPRPYEFRAKPTWQKVVVITAGVIMNLLLALGVFWGVKYFKGEQVIKTTTVGEVIPNSSADSLGFKKGDKIIEINNRKVDNWHEVTAGFFVHGIGEDINVVVERNGAEEEIKIPSSRMPDDSAIRDFLIFDGISRPIVDSVLSGSRAEQAGLIKGDMILAINDIPIYTPAQSTEIISSHKDEPLTITVQRDNDTVSLAATPGADGIIGINIGQRFTGEIETKKYGFFESFYYGWQDIVNVTNLTFNVLGKVFSGNVEFGKAFGGPIKIAQFAAKSADTGFIDFLYFLALLSLSLAIINIMPFPVLDGGHLIIILVEGAMKREIPIRIKIAIQNVGFVILLLLMAFIIYSDILSL